MPLTRRDLLFGLGGGLAGVALTPVPWKLLDDTAIWTQRRHALPVPPRGPVTFRPAACTLCPGGCALRVRCVGPRPVAVAGEAGHPLGGGACAFGLTLHHLAYHPLRLDRPGAAARAAGASRSRSTRRSASSRAAVEAARASGRSGDGRRPAPGPGRLAAWRRADGRAPARPST